MGFPQLFQRFSTKKKKENDDVTETFRTLVDARFDRLESNFRLLKGEWEDAYEKISLLYDRSRKRLQAIQKASDKEKPVIDAPAPPVTREQLMERFLTQNGL